MATFCDVLILGGGPSGVLAAGWLAVHKPEWSVIIVEPGKLMGSYADGGLRYLRASDPLLGFLLKLRELGGPTRQLRHTITEVAGAALLEGGQVVPYPDGLGERVADVQRLHYAKTRGTLEGFTPESMNFAGTDQRRVQVNHEDLAALCTLRAVVLQERATRVSEMTATIQSGGVVEARRFVISTLPLPLYLTLQGAPTEVRPTLRHRWLRVFPVGALSFQMDQWDYVYTPWLKRVHRLSWSANDIGVDAEFNEGEPDDVHTWASEVWEDMMVLGGLEGATARVTLNEQSRRMPGHLLPPIWNDWHPEECTHLLGRFAAWDGRFTADKVISKLGEWDEEGLL